MRSIRARMNTGGFERLVEPAVRIGDLEACAVIERNEAGGLRRAAPTLASASRVIASSVTSSATTVSVRPSTRTSTLRAAAVRPSKRVPPNTSALIGPPRLRPRCSTRPRRCPQRERNSACSLEDSVLKKTMCRPPLSSTHRPNGIARPRPR